MSDRPSHDDKPRPTATAAIIWTFGANQIESIMAIANTMILARLLTPADFGVVAIATSVVALGEVFIAFGFDWALLRIQNPTRAHYDTAWTMRAMCSLIVFLVLSAAAVPAASILQQPETIWLIIAISGTGLISALQNIGIVDFRRYMQLDAEFRLRVAAKTAGVIVGLGAAVATRSYWSLVAGVLASRLAHTLLSFYMHKFRPRIDLSAHADLLSFSIWMLVTRITEVLHHRFSEMWLGRNLGASSAGLYSLASELSELASSQISAPVQRVMFTRYAEHANTQPLLQEAFLKVSSAVWAIAFPAAVGIGVCADQIVSILLGPQWTTSASILRILAAAGVVAVVSSSTHTMYMAAGWIRFTAILSGIAAAVFIILTLMLGPWYGVLGVAIAQVGAAIIALIVNLTVLRRAAGIPVMALFARNWRVLAAGTIMGIFVHKLPGLWSGYELAALPELLLMVAAGVTSYFITIGILWMVTKRPEGPEEDLLELLQQTSLGRRVLGSSLRRAR